jgi:osmotically-inducible protein OsmY
MPSGTTSDIIKKINAGLERDTRVNLHRSPVTVRLDGETVFLEGEMHDISEKRAAVALTARALSQSGSWRVVDRLSVKPVEHRENLELKREVVAALGGEPVFRDYTLVTVVAGNVDMIHDGGTPDREIRATIESGGIDLSGRVQSHSHKRLAEVSMWWTDGCRFVDNRLEVFPPEEDTDDDITDTVRIVLEKDPLVHADQFSIATSEGTVVLVGSVATREEKKIAVQDAWYVPGVADVVDQIETRD